MTQKYFIFLLISILFLIPTNSQQHFDPESWQKAAKYLQEAMDKSVKPCDNFFDHVCGNYRKLFNDSEYFDYTISGKSEEIVEIFVKAINRIDLKQNDLPKYKKAIKVFYDQCSSIEVDSKWPQRLYEAVAKRFGKLSLFENVKRNGAAKTDPNRQPSSGFNPWQWMGRIQRELGTEVVIQAAVGLITDRKSCQQQVMIQISPLAPPPVPLDANTTRFVLTKLAENIGLEKTDLESKIDPWLQKVMTIYDDWYNLSDRTVGDGKLIAPVNMSLEAPNVDWKAFINGLLPVNVQEQVESDPTTEIFIVNVDLTDGIGALFKKFDPDTIKSFLYLQALVAIMDKHFGEVKSFQLIHDMKTAKERCLDYALQYLSPAMAHLYFDAIGQDITHWRNDIIQLQRNIFSAFRFLLNSVDWLDLEDKDKIQQKVDAIKFNPGIPSWIENEDEVMKKIFFYNISLDPFENEFVTAENKSDQTFIEIFSADQRNENVEDEPSFKINAEYNGGTNVVTMFLGLMVPPLYSVTYPLPVKYGGFGSVLGHELMHAFDAHNIIFGAYEDQEWLKEESFRGYEKKKSCYVREYSKNCYEDKGLCIDGERNIGENIADIDGLKVVYLAYKIASQVVGADPPIPEMLDYTNDQIFFLAFARTQCAKGAPTVSRIINEHTPNRPRVDMALRNMPMFGKAFKCPMGSRYVPVTRCSLWGDIEESAKN